MLFSICLVDSGIIHEYVVRVELLYTTYHRAIEKKTVANRHSENGTLY